MTHSKNFIDLTGQKYNKITFIEFAGTNSSGNARWKCRCDCGTVFIADAHNIKRGSTRSCGCLKVEKCREVARSMSPAWTQKEDDTLRRLYPVKPTEELTKVLKRSRRAIEQRAFRLGIKKSFSPGIEWTPQMLKLLIDFFPTMFNKPLAKWIGVSQRSLTRKARELGLEKKEGFLESRRKDIQQLAAEALRRTPDTKGTRFKKGEHRYPAGEFKPGHKESAETRAKRIAALKEAWKRKKAATVKYY